MHILCSVPTKDRYLTTLPGTLTSIALQTRVPDELIIYDNSEHRIDIRNIPVYQYVLRLLDEKKIKWSVLYLPTKGQHHSHEHANNNAKELVFRVDDDCVIEPNVLEVLEKTMISENAGIVAGLVIDPTNVQSLPSNAENKITRMYSPNVQWFKWIGNNKEVEHVYSSFLYKKGISHYDLRLSNVAHREETIFSYGAFKNGYKLIVTPNCTTWHFRNPEGGIRSSGNQDDFNHDEDIFREWIGFKNKDRKLYVINGGVGDNYMFLQAITPEDGSMVATCYTECYEKFPNIEIISIAQAQKMVDIEQYNIYQWCAQHNWKGTLIDAFKELYK